MDSESLDATTGAGRKADAAPREGGVSGELTQQSTQKRASSAASPEPTRPASGPRPGGAALGVFRVRRRGADVAGGETEQQPGRFFRSRDTKSGLPTASAACSSCTTNSGRLCHLAMRPQGWSDLGTGAGAQSRASWLELWRGTVVVLPSARPGLPALASEGPSRLPA